MDLNSIEDKELYELLEKATLAERLENDPAWKMLREAGNRIVDRAVDEFALRSDPKNIEQIINLKTIIKKYKYGIFQEVEMLKRESEFAFEEAKDRGIIGGFMDSVKEKVGL